MLKGTFLVIAAVVVLAEATNVRQCSNGKNFDSIKQVDITSCEKTPCKLKKKTTVSIEERFVPEHDVDTLTNSVSATILGVPLPFIGVDGTDACENIYTAEGTESGCPLKAGTEYVYKNKFPIYEVYPRVSLVVKWALKENGKTITCFEAPSQIIN